MDKPENKTVRVALSSRCMYLLCVVSLFEDDFEIKSKIYRFNVTSGLKDVSIVLTKSPRRE